MANINVSINNRKCVFCKFWQGEAATSAKMRNYWSVNPSAKGLCLQKRYEKRSTDPACNKFEPDIKYPKV